MGIMAIVFAFLTVGLNFQPKLPLGISLLSGLGSLGYGFFWLLAAVLAPGMGSTSAAKEGVTVFLVVILKLFVQGKKTFSLPGSL